MLDYINYGRVYNANLGSINALGDKLEYLLFKG
jgi:hypothetical protein